MNMLYIYWWNFKRLVQTTWYWIAILFVLGAVSVFILESLSMPSILGAAVGSGLLIVFFWKLGASLREKFPYTEEDILDELNEGVDEGFGGAAAYCSYCEISLMADEVDENQKCTKCGGPVRVGEAAEPTPAWKKYWWLEDD